jgi:hypothetical protein
MVWGGKINEVFFILLGRFQISSGTLSQEDETFCQNKTSQLQSEQTSVKTVATEQVIVLRSSLQTVGYRSADVAGKWKSQSNSVTTEHEEKTRQSSSPATFWIVTFRHMITFDNSISPLKEDYGIILPAKVFAQRGVILP